MKLRHSTGIFVAAAILLTSLSSCQKSDPVTPTPEEPLSELDKLLADKKTGSPLKKQYSDYVKTYKETTLLNFDTQITSGIQHDDFTYAIDSKYQREGTGVLRVTANQDYRNKEALLMWPSTPISSLFQCSVKDRKTSTLKLWLFVDNVENVGCDHDKTFGDYADQATFFFRVFDKDGRVWNWNHTLTGNGWHEVELSFNVHNGYSEGFDFSNIVSFGLMAKMKKGTVIELDALRLVEYSTTYTAPTMKEGERLISNAEHDALDGAIMQEWYGASYDLEDKVEGKSSLRNCGDGSVSDFRTIIANLNIQLNYSEDILVFNMKIKELSSINSIFIELNEVQDTHEYEQTFSKTTLISKGLTRNDTWTEISIPLTEFTKHLGTGFASGENIVLHNFRLVAATGAVSSFDLHVDNIYIKNKAE